MLRRNAVEAFRTPVLWRRMLSSEGAGNVIKDVRSLRSGLTARDLDQVWEAWTSLRAQQALDQLRRHDYADLLALVRANLSTFSHESCRQEAWKNRCLAWGMNAAERMDMLGVQGWMKVEMLCGNPVGAIQLFHAYVAARRRARAQTESMQEPHILDAGQRREPVRDMIEVLILAYASEQDLHGLVHTMQSFDVGTHTELFFDLAHSQRQFTKLPWLRGNAAFKLPADVCERALDWVSHAELARGLLDGSGGHAGPNRIARLLGSLLARGDVPSAWRLYQTAMRAGILEPTSPAAWLAQEQLAPQERERRLLPAWTDSAWVVCLSGFLAADRRDLAAQVWQDLAAVQPLVAATGAEWPPVAVWNAVLDGFSRCGDMASVQATWHVLHGHLPAERMPLSHRAKGLRAPPDGPDLVCYTTMMSALFRARQVNMAMTLHNELQAKQARQELRIPIETYNAVLHGLCVSRRTEEAYALLRSMGRNGVPAPTITTINVVLRAQARQKNLPAMAATLRQILPLGLRPDVITFTTVLDTLLRVATQPAAAEQAVDQVMQIMQSMHVQPNSITFTAMIKACLHTKGDSHQPRLPVALQLMHTMCTNVKLAPTPVTMEIMTEGLLQNERFVETMLMEYPLPSTFQRAPVMWPDEQHEMPLHATRLALVLWQLMMDWSMTPTNDTYLLLVRTLLKDGTNHVLFRRGVLIADALLYAQGSLSALVNAPTNLHVILPSTPPASASWSAVLRALIRSRPSDLSQRVLHGVLLHFAQSPHGEQALTGPQAANPAAHLTALVEQARRKLGRCS